MRNVAHSPRFFRLLAALAVALLATNPAQAQNALRWKFQPGEALKYEMGQKATIKQSRMDQSVETTLAQTLDTTWTVKSAENDVANLVIKIDRHRLNLTAPTASLNYDSKEGKPPEGPIGQALAPVFEAMAGAEFNVKMDSRGEITEVKVAQKLLDAVKALPNAGAGGAFSEERLKDQFKQSVLVFPKEPVKQGGTWTGKLEVPSQPTAFVLDNTYTDAGSSSQNPKLEQIDLKINLTLKPGAEAQVKVDLKSQEGKGTFLFDRDKGCLADSNVIRKHELEFKVGGMVAFTQTIDSTETMKLNP